MCVTASNTDGQISYEMGYGKPPLLEELCLFAAVSSMQQTAREKSWSRRVKSAFVDHFSRAPYGPFKVLQHLYPASC